MMVLVEGTDCDDHKGDFFVADQPRFTRDSEADRSLPQLGCHY